VPVPLLCVVVAAAQPPQIGWIFGLVVITVGAAIRLWGVAHLGSVGRTRAATVGTLVQAGPYRYSRNPLYVGNLIIYIGVVVMVGRPVLSGVVVSAMWVHYRLIVHWEEWFLSSELGEPYQEYCQNVSRWVGVGGVKYSPPTHAWKIAIRSERPTWLAIGTVVVALVCRGVVQM